MANVFNTTEIILTENQQSQVIPEGSLNIQTVALSFYFDRMYLNSDTDFRHFYFDQFDPILEGIVDDFTKNTNKRAKKDFGEWYMGTNFALKEKALGKDIFKTKGELFIENATQQLYMNTKIRPIFINNQKLNEYAIESCIAFYYHIISNAKPELRFILGGILDNMLKTYTENTNISIGYAPSHAVLKVMELEGQRNSDWFKEISKMLGV